MNVNIAKNTTIATPSRVGVAIAALTATVLVGGGTGAQADAAPSGTWQDCGSRTCTTYFSKSETKVIANYFNGVAGVGASAERIACGAAGGVLSKVAGVAAAGICSFEVYGVSGWQKAANTAVDKGGCLKVEANKKGPSLKKPGHTTHKKYCSK